MGWSNQRRQSCNCCKAINCIHCFFFPVPSRAPRNIMVSNVWFDEVKVEWDALPQWFANGRLLGYTVVYQEVSYLRTTSVKTLDTNSPLANTVILRGLKTAHRYRISVAAFTSKGVGPQSYRKYITIG